MPMTAPFSDRAGNELYRGTHADDAAALTHCAANGINLAYVNLSGRTLDGADISGLWAPGSDWSGASARNIVADRAVDGRICELSASVLQTATISGTLTHANLSCTHPTRFRATVGTRTVLRGADWSDCPDVIVLPVAKRERDRVGRVVAARNGTGWRVHAGSRGVLTEADARTTLAAVPEYAETIAYLDSQDYQIRKAEVESRPAGEARLDSGGRVR